MTTRKASTAKLQRVLGLWVIRGLRLFMTPPINRASSFFLGLRLRGSGLVPEVAPLQVYLWSRHDFGPFQINFSAAATDGETDRHGGLADEVGCGFALL